MVLDTLPGPELWQPHGFATSGHRYLFVEWDDAGFGARAAAVHKRLQAALAADTGGPGERALAGISAQMALMAQLRHLSSELRARCPIRATLLSCRQ